MTQDTSAKPTLKRYEGKTKALIHGAQLKELKKLPDDRGWLMELMRSDWPEFTKFGQVYITCVYPGIIKAFHYHLFQTDYWVPAAGLLQVALVDLRTNSKTFGAKNTLYIGALRPWQLRIPPGDGPGSWRSHSQ